LKVHKQFKVNSILIYVKQEATLLLLLLLPGAELPLVESFGFLNNLFPFSSILNAGYPILVLHLANVLFDIILPSVLGSSL
jgi:hypothetical protein